MWAISVGEVAAEPAITRRPAAAGLDGDASDDESGGEGEEGDEGAML